MRVGSLGARSRRLSTWWYGKAQAISSQPALSSTAALVQCSDGAEAQISLLQQCTMHVAALTAIDGAACTDLPTSLALQLPATASGRWDMTTASATGKTPPQCRGFAAATAASHHNKGRRKATADRRDGSPGAGPAADATSSVRPGEADKFAKLAAEWWDPKGPMAPLHAMNPLRARFVRDAICRNFQLDKRQAQPLAGLRILDVGCGGGLLSESLARMGANVTGIDIAERNIDIAKAHAGNDPRIAARTNYRATSAEALVAEGAAFDVVTALEVIEHVADQPGFCGSLSALTRDWGAVLVSTLSRTPQAYALAIMGAEYVARLLPVGTHDWSQFVTPKELVMMGDDAGLELETIAGMAYDPIGGLWRMTDNTGVNYIAYFQKPALVRPPPPVQNPPAEPLASPSPPMHSASKDPHY